MLDDLLAKDNRDRLLRDNAKLESVSHTQRIVVRFGAMSVAPLPLATIPTFPDRPDGAPTGSAFLAQTAGASIADREKAILREILSGNLPNFQRTFRPVTVSAQNADGTVYVIADYLAIGTDEDYVRMPMSPLTAQTICDAFGCLLPTTKLVDDVYAQARFKLAPAPQPPGPQMTGNDAIRRHNETVARQLQAAGAMLGALIAGHQKDVVVSNVLVEHPDRVAIYGWHQLDGVPIQPLSTVHENTYADYSHGIRLVAASMIMNGREVPLATVLADATLSAAVSKEGAVARPRQPGV